MVVQHTKKVAKRYQKQQLASEREQLIVEHIDYANMVLQTLIKSLPPATDKDNLVAAGMLGLTEAAYSFDPDRGINFKTFAYPRIRGAFVDEMRRSSPLPQKVMQDVQVVRDAIEKLQPDATPEAVAQSTGFTLEKVSEIFAAMKVSSPKAWDEIGSFVDHRRNNPTDRLESSELLHQLAKAIEGLPKRERLVITMYYMESMLLKEIGVVLGISESRVSRILARAEFRLRQAFFDLDSE